MMILTLRRVFWLSLLFSFGFVWAGEQPVQTPAGEVPGFVFDIEDGLYATITADAFEEPKIKGEVNVKLKPEGFAKDIEVRVLWQSERRPLVVLIPGMVDWSTAKETQLWKSYLHVAGFHVLTFDSPFLASFNDRSRHGVIGNLSVEAWLVAHLIHAFLEQPQARERVTETALVGLSYGGTVALNIARQAAEKRIAFRPKRVLAFSPPVKMETSACLLDTFYAEHRWDYKLVDLARDLADHKPVPKGEPVPFTAAEMRAGMAVLFRFGLKGAVLYGDYRYKLGLLPKEPTEYRRDVAETWTFRRFVQEMALPYWSKRAAIRTAEEFWAPGDLLGLLKGGPDSVHVVLSADDPLNDPDELKALCDGVEGGRLTVLPRGGHLGYGRTEWAKARVARLFEDGGP